MASTQCQLKSRKLSNDDAANRCVYIIHNSTRINYKLFERFLSLAKLFTNNKWVIQFFSQMVPSIQLPCAVCTVQSSAPNGKYVCDRWHVLVDFVRGLRETGGVRKAWPDRKSTRFTAFGVWKRAHRAHTHTHTHKHAVKYFYLTSGCQKEWKCKHHTQTHWQCYEQTCRRISFDVINSIP